MSENRQKEKGSELPYKDYDVGQATVNICYAPQYACILTEFGL